MLFDEGGKNFGQHAEGIFLAYWPGADLNNELEQVVLAVATHKMDYAELAEWFRARLKKIDA